MNRRLLPAVLVLILALVLMPLLGDLIQAAVVYPLLYTIALVREVGSVIPQWVFWGAFILISAIVAVRTVLSVRARSGTAADTGVSYAGPVARWARRINLADRGGEYAGWVLTQRLGELAIEARQAARHDIPREPTATTTPETAALLARIEATCRTQSFRQFQSEMPDTLSQADVDRVVAFLEMQLGLDRDDAG
jgi:hypothetical protein